MSSGSARMMESIFMWKEPQIQAEWDDDRQEEGIIETSAETYLAGLTEASQAMAYDSDTSNDELYDGSEGEDEQWDDERTDESERGQIESDHNGDSPGPHFEDQPSCCE